ncbi:hypothetical protein BN7_5190 [Wickerhamomyces ciferrii]|uniref:SAC domain-containing protein n=1 Tax=Wickerhamomyces ciferrii (strain ATCC 14091 / BCRC 22168 / CBS 111 / JCM 3599 / NBRC 0793 / NRRL Y-1031 F-60-10) TaxID=1206466 RepID=K0KUB6_WICCF|nr:uncharacterized protein BN7_5190 [Wickerhamomyces ciferrii]CCH45607.1 hypothetical protein BN7_5190 [Wickerhamomyces ciferrii]
MDKDQVQVPLEAPAPPVPILQNASNKSRKLILQKYTIYETSTRVYIVGSNGRETMFRVLEIDLTTPKEELSIVEDNVFFTRKEIMDVLSKLEETSEEGLMKRLTGFGLLGFIRFTDCYYLCVVTKRSPIAILGGHYIYHIDDTELIPISNNYRKPDNYSEEARFLATFANLDLSKTFYFSYTYDLTNTLQRNILREKRKAYGFPSNGKFHDQYNEMFIWNSSLLKPIMQTYDRIYDWFQPIIHGFIDQANVSIFDKKIYITVIARRSHHFAGARFLKRGVNNQGNVANEVETEQIVSDLLTTSFHDSKMGFYNNPRYTSYVQHRGSIPLFWSQEGTNLKLAKPPIEIDIVDPFYSSAALHFDDLFKRYDCPILILNLIKVKERNPRETKLLKEFEECINYLNKFLPEDNKLNYTSWDMSRASKSDGQDVIEFLETYADQTLQKTGIFHNGSNFKGTNLQEGICRTNCIDCLDRTNAAQFVIGKKALGYQLFALGIIDDVFIDYDSDVVNILTEMFHDHGDTIALQYGGSHLVNTMETYRKINQWSSHSRDMIESIKRFYSNSFIDAQRQEAINLFLGNYVWEKGKPMLWDLNTDYYLHNIQSLTSHKFKRSYTHWWTDSNLIKFNEYYDLKFDDNDNEDEERLEPYQGFFDNYWNEYYVPRKLTFFEKLFEINMNSTLRYISPSQNLEEAFNISPFKSRKQTSINYKLKKLELQRRKRANLKNNDDSDGKNLNSSKNLEFLVTRQQLNELSLSSNKFKKEIEITKAKEQDYIFGNILTQEDYITPSLTNSSISTPSFQSTADDNKNGIYDSINQNIEVSFSNLKIYSESCNQELNVLPTSNNKKEIETKESLEYNNLLNLPKINSKDYEFYESMINLQQ